MRELCSQCYNDHITICAIKYLMHGEGILIGTCDLFRNCNKAAVCDAPQVILKDLGKELLMLPAIEQTWKEIINSQQI